VLVQSCSCYLSSSNAKSSSLPQLASFLPLRSPTSSRELSPLASNDTNLSTSRHLLSLVPPAPARLSDIWQVTGIRQTSSSNTPSLRSPSSAPRYPCPTGTHLCRRLLDQSHWLLCGYRGQAPGFPPIHPTPIPRLHRHQTKMAPSATQEPAPMQLPVFSKASSINASVLHGPRDLRLVNASSPCPSTPGSHVTQETGVCCWLCYFWSRTRSLRDLMHTTPSVTCS